jgi:hypothetical protein
LKNKKDKKKTEMEENKARRIVESINLVELATQCMTKKQAKISFNKA